MFISRPTKPSRKPKPASARGSDERPHQALDYLTPCEFFEAQKTCGHVDNASALPTSPQAQQQLQQNGDSHEKENLIRFADASRALRVEASHPPGRNLSYITKILSHSPGPPYRLLLVTFFVRSENPFFVSNRSPGCKGCPDL